MTSLVEYLDTYENITIYTLAEYIGKYLAGEWEGVLNRQRERLVKLYDETGDGAYGQYARSLFNPVQQQLSGAGFASAPAFPGKLAFSLEWGSADARQRWMWSVVHNSEGVPLGTLVTILYHDHTRFRLPCAPEVVAFEETETNAIRQRISKAAKNFTVG